MIIHIKSERSFSNGKTSMDDFQGQGRETAVTMADAYTLSRAERRDQQAQRILDAAKACFVRSGFQGASMQEVCAEVGMSPGALYRYFPSKEAIIEAICEADRQQDVESFIAFFQNPSIVDGLVEAAVAHITHVHERGNAALFAEIRAESTRNETIQTTCLKCQQQVYEIIRERVRFATERGEIDPPVDLDTLMATLMAIGEGIALNDLPSLGVPVANLEILLRAMVEGMLRPTGRTAADSR
jgi:AcrR family transcriptional regulator